MNQDPKFELEPHLHTYEELKWTGTPKRGIVFRTHDVWMTPLSLIGLGVIILWTLFASLSGSSLYHFGIVGIILGLFFVFGRFIIDAQKRANTVYGLTGKRIIIKSGVFSKSITSIKIRMLSNIEYSEKRDGSGTITWGPKKPKGSEVWYGISFSPSLDLIPEVRKVYQEIIELRKKNRRHSNQSLPRT